jgi:tetratricopeptide (TPR) repeat protein
MPNLSYTFDSNLRDIPDSPQDVEAEITSLSTLLSALPSPEPGTGNSDRIRLLGQLGHYSRLLNRLDEAERYLRQALDLSRQQDARIPLLVNSIRLAHVYQWQGRFDLAEPIFLDAIRLCEDPASEYADYLDFALQHYGKCLFDMGRYREAEVCFAKALQIRNQKGDPDLIQSTQYALDVVRSRLAAPA